MSTSQHWYDRLGNSAHQVPAKKGGMKATTIRDAKALGLLPSVTTVLSVLAKPQLERWKLEQVAFAAYAKLTQPIAFANKEAFAQVVVEEAFEPVSEAADLGTAIHAAIEAWGRDESYDPAMGEYVDAVQRWLTDNGCELIEQELRLVSLEHGFAGTTDAVFRKGDKLGILDFKSRKTKVGVPCEPWDTEPMQIAAYSVAKWGDDLSRMLEGRIGCNVYISTTEPGRVEGVFYDTARMDSEWDAFQAALTLWRHVKQYDPRVRREEVAA